MTKLLWLNFFIIWKRKWCKVADKSWGHTWVKLYRAFCLDKDRETEGSALLQPGAYQNLGHAWIKQYWALYLNTQDWWFGTASSLHILELRNGRSATGLPSTIVHNYIWILMIFVVTVIWRSFENLVNRSLLYVSVRCMITCRIQQTLPTLVLASGYAYCINPWTVRFGSHVTGLETTTAAFLATITVAIPRTKATRLVKATYCCWWQWSHQPTCRSICSVNCSEFCTHSLLPELSFQAVRGKGIRVTLYSYV